MLREYQQRTIDQLYDWLRNYDGHPCIVLPTGSGKSHVIAELCKNALQSWPETRILMLTHQKELIEQNAEKLLIHWPDAPMGIFSASIGEKNLEEPITFAGIQSVRIRSKEIGHVDLIMIDECHRASHNDEGMYRKLINELIEINPALRVIGYTATPYRLGHGLITDKPALFDALIEPTSIEELIYKGYLTTLRSKVTKEKLDASGIHKRGGEYIESEMQEAFDTALNNRQVVSEIIELGSERKSWLIFCAGVDHAEHIRDELIGQGIIAECVTGKTPKKEREKILQEYKQGNIRALTNANVLTTGFDHPGIDLIALLRATMSPGLYYQMVGRGLRISPEKENCIVLDFAGVIQQHGPITAIRPPKKPGEKQDVMVTIKVCDQCGEILHPAVRTCPACGFEFPRQPPKPLMLHSDDIMGINAHELSVTTWKWSPHISQTSGKEMIKVTYYGCLSDPSVTEYFPILHYGYAGEKALRTIAQIARNSGISKNAIENEMLHIDALESICKRFNDAKHPESIAYRKDGKFYRVINRSW
jgi:DNA repair protein RadD